MKDICHLCMPPAPHLLFAISGSVAVLDIVPSLRPRDSTLPLLDNFDTDKWRSSGSRLSSWWPLWLISSPECFSVFLWTERIHQEKQPGYSIASLSRARIRTKMAARPAPNIIWSNIFLEAHYPRYPGNVSEKTHWDNRFTLRCHIVQACLNAVNRIFSSGIFCKICRFYKDKKWSLEFCHKLKASFYLTSSISSFSQI